MLEVWELDVELDGDRSVDERRESVGEVSV